MVRYQAPFLFGTSIARLAGLMLWPAAAACSSLPASGCLRCYSSYRLLDNGLCVRLSCTTETVHNILSMTKSLVAAQQASRYAANQSGIAHGEEPTTAAIPYCRS